MLARGLRLRLCGRLPPMPRPAAGLRRRGTGGRSAGGGGGGGGVGVGTLRQQRQREQFEQLQAQMQPTPPPSPASTPSASSGQGGVWANHGGKIALAIVGSICLMIYRFVASGWDKDRCQEELEEYSVLDPYEIAELRTSNRLNRWKYWQIVERTTQEYPSGTIPYSAFVNIVLQTMLPSALASASVEETTPVRNGQPANAVQVEEKDKEERREGRRIAQDYAYASRDRDRDLGAELTAARQQLKKKLIRRGYLLDRAVFGSTVATAESLLSCADEATESIVEEARQQKAAGEFPLSFLLTSLSLTVQTGSPRARVALLRSMMERVHGREFRQADAVELITNLKHSFQLPVQKQIVPTGIRVPITTYREADAFDMFLAAMAELEKGPDRNTWFGYFRRTFTLQKHPAQDLAKQITEEKRNAATVADPAQKRRWDPTHTRNRIEEMYSDPLTVEQLHDMLSTKHVCAWGECYRVA